jgi:hypothetical protein
MLAVHQRFDQGSPAGILAVYHRFHQTVLVQQLGDLAEAILQPV